MLHCKQHSFIICCIVNNTACMLFVAYLFRVALHCTKNDTAYHVTAWTAAKKSKNSSDFYFQCGHMCLTCALGLASLCWCCHRQSVAAKRSTFDVRRNVVAVLSRQQNFGFSDKQFRFVLTFFLFLRRSHIALCLVSHRKFALFYNNFIGKL